MSKLIFKYQKDPEPHPTEVTQDEKAALFPRIQSVVRIVDRVASGKPKISETENDEDILKMRSFR